MALATLALLLVAGLVASCFPAAAPPDGAAAPPPDDAARLAAIPSGAVKVTPAGDLLPPVVHLPGWGDPYPLPGPVNTAGAEDSPFLAPDGSALYFFFTPDMSVPVTEQVTDGLTGVWVSRRQADGAWGSPTRLILGDIGEPSMDGCVVIQGDTLWFGSVRAGNYGEVDVWTAPRRGDGWGEPRNAGRLFNQDWDIGEFHLMADGQTLFFEAPRPEGYGGVPSYGGQDLWVSHRTADGWSLPQNLGPGVNTADNEGQPFVTADGRELWFTGLDRAGYPGSTVWRSTLGADGLWGEAELVLSNLAGEPCLDAAGNIYFIHHFLGDGRLIEADIYVAPKE